MGANSTIFAIMRKSAGKFLKKGELESSQTPWGPMQWLSRPQTTGAKDLVCTIVDLAAGGFHNFHKHPGQEEVIYVLRGRIEQWVEDQHQILHAGDAVFIGSGVVHASFNVGRSTAQLFVALGPSVGRAGYKAVDVSTKKPWQNLRSLLK
jgi:quercetin dioxygenase-like cupin family protein